MYIGYVRQFGVWAVNRTWNIRNTENCNVARGIKLKITSFILIYNRKSLPPPNWSLLLNCTALHYSGIPYTTLNACFKFTLYSNNKQNIYHYHSSPLPHYGLAAILPSPYKTKPPSILQFDIFNLKLCVLYRDERQWTDQPTVIEWSLN